VTPLPYTQPTGPGAAALATRVTSVLAAHARMAGELPVPGHHIAYPEQVVSGLRTSGEYRDFIARRLELWNAAKSE
jgi:hypothetical protein